MGWGVGHVMVVFGGTGVGHVMVVWSVFRSISLLVDYWFDVCWWGLRRSNGGKRQKHP